MKYITIKADTNDADYIEQTAPITDKDLQEIMPVIEAIKQFKPYTVKINKGRVLERIHKHNFPYGDCLREDLGELSPQEYYKQYHNITEEQFSLFIEFLPAHEWGIHTIKSIVVREVVSETKLL